MIRLIYPFSASPNTRKYVKLRKITEESTLLRKYIEIHFLKREPSGPVAPAKWSHKWSQGQSTIGVTNYFPSCHAGVVSRICCPRPQIRKAHAATWIRTSSLAPNDLPNLPSFCATQYTQIREIAQNYRWIDTFAKIDRNTLPGENILAR